MNDMYWRGSQQTIVQLFLPYDAIKLKNWKTEKLKNWIHMENLFLVSMENSVFQFFSFGSGTIPE